LTISKAESIDDRVKNLNGNNFKNRFLYENELVKEVIKKYLNWYSDNKESTFKPILCNYNLTQFKFYNLK
jgi:hypothetical protein